MPSSAPLPDRYFVDKRIGCVAVRDRQNTDPDYPGLWPDTEGVVEFWPIALIKIPCPTCGHGISEWADGKAEVVQANELAERMNEDNRLRSVRG